MIEIDKTYEYAVAFSFLQQDEGIVYEINDLIQDRYKTFLYSERQKEIAGTDGEKTFNEVFSEKARIVVVLYREEWGTTSWTRIEETAIRNRAFKEGYDFTTFVQLDLKSKMPKWLPKYRIYQNFDRWGTKGLAPVIEARIQESGGISKPDTLEDIAARMKRQVLNQKERQIFLNSPDGYIKAEAEFDKLFNLLKAKTKSLEDSEMNLRFSYETHEGSLFIVRCDGYSLLFSCFFPYFQSIINSSLTIDLAYTLQGNTTSLKCAKLNFDYNPSNKETGWSIKSKENDFFSSEKLMDKWLKLFLEKISKIKIERQI